MNRIGSSSSADVERGSVSCGITQPGIQHTCRQLEGEDEVLGDDLGGLVALSAEPPHPRLEEEVGRHRGGQLLGVDDGGWLFLLEVDDLSGTVNQEFHFHSKS